MTANETESAQMGEPAVQSSEKLSVADADPKLVPVSEAIRYRKRAQAAEETVAELRQQLEVVEGDLRETSNRMANAEQSQTIDRGLVEAGVVDFESARLLVGEAMGADPDHRDVTRVIAEVRERKPHLFRVESATSS